MLTELWRALLIPLILFGALYASEWCDDDPAYTDDELDWLAMHEQQDAGYEREVGDEVR